MNIGFLTCILLSVFFSIIALIFTIMRGKASILISGFNTLPMNVQKLYDKDFLVRDMRNLMFLLGFIMLIGALLSYFITPYIAILAFIIFLFIFLKNVSLDNKKAFLKYKKK